MRMGRCVNRAATKGDRVACAVHPRSGRRLRAGGVSDGVMGGQGKAGGLLIGV